VPAKKPIICPKYNHSYGSAHRKNDGFQCNEKRLLG
jgi:hypothetical protein